MNKKSVLVTGCAGFIGGNFSRSFKKRFPDTEIIGIDNFSTSKKEHLPKEVTFYEGSIEDKNLLKKIFSKHKPEYVFHFAAVPRVSYSVENPTATSIANIVGTIALLEESKNSGVKRFIFSSSSSIYGGAAKLPTKESDSPANPKSPYAMQKFVGENFCKLFSELYKLDTIVLRYFNVFGPGQYGDSPYSTVLSAWLEAAFKAGSKPYLEGDGTQSRDFCYVDNVIEANILAMDAEGKFSGEAFNIAYGERTSLNQAKELIEKYAGRKLAIEKRPPRVGDVAHSHAAISLAKEKLGYNPKISFEEGLKKTIDWQRSRSL